MVMDLNFRNREEYSFYLHLYLKQEKKAEFRNDFLALHPTDQVEIFKEFSAKKRKLVYQYLELEEVAVVFVGLETDEQKQVITELEDNYIIQLLQELSADDVTDFLGEIPDHISEYFLARMDKQEADTIKSLLSYEEDSAGAMMTTEYVKANVSETVSEVMSRLHVEGEEAETIYYIYVVDERNKLLGVVSLRDLITSTPQMKVSELMKEQLISVYPEIDQEEVAKVIKDYDLIAVPVMAMDGTLVGIVTVDDVMDIVEEEVTEDIEDFAAARGTIDLEISAPLAAKRRLPWLLVLLFLGFGTAALIGSFEQTLAEIALLAIFIPLIADMGGNTGTQSLVVVIRGIATGKLDRSMLYQLLKRELLTGLIMGSICGILVMLVALAFDFGNIILGVVVGISIFCTIVFSTIIGTVIPWIIHRLKIDPAVASGPFITTINDITGLLIYFSIAKALLL
ncbi:magnesium transporter [Bacillus sp. FJAT-45350]|uniref:magnesium transporter n=1 Tax=Bacillus sp. FJAT-45350 TaxID=2011014 RepID=UPI000BB92C49|nr:magnesium transporter [Bacillus sp. FJAT-45350]